MKTMKVFDIVFDFPEDVKKIAYDMFQEDIKGNDGYIELGTFNFCEEEYAEEYIKSDEYINVIGPKLKILEEWFLANGWDGEEDFLLKYWW